MQTCSLCGKYVEGEPAFCPHCGGRMAQAAPPAEALATEATGSQTAPPPDLYAQQQPVYGGQPPYAPPPAGAPAPASAPGYPGAPAANAGTGFFCSHVLGVIPLALFALVSLGLLAAAGGMALSAANMRNVFMQAATVVPLYVAAALTVRAKGPDFSLAAMLALGAYVFSSAGMVAALLVAAVCGLANGALIVALRLPAAVVSLVVSSIYLGVCMVVTDGMPLSLEGRYAPSPALFFVAVLLCVVVGFLYNFLTPLGLAKEQRERQGEKPLFHLLAYPLAAVLAAVSGVLLVVRMNAYMPTIGGTSYYIYLALVWAALSSTRLADNKAVPILYAALLGGVQALCTNAMSIMGVSAFIQQIAVGLIAVLFLIVAGVARIAGSAVPERLR